MNYILVLGGDISANDFAALCGIISHDDSTSLLGAVFGLGWRQY